MALYIVTQTPKRKYSGVFKVVVSVCDATTAKEALAKFGVSQSAEYTKPIAELLKLDQPYFL